MKKKNTKLLLRKPVRVRLKTKILALLTLCLLLCGFSWNWVITFTAQALFPVEAAVDLEMIQNFPALINVDDLQRYLTEPQMAEEISQGIQTNLSADLYREIELPDIRLEHPGKRIIRIILDRIFR